MGHRALSPVSPPASPFRHLPVSVLLSLSAGTYPLCRPPDAWLPGVPALSGPCYWLVASGTPMGWRRGCLATGLLRDALHQYCFGRCSALIVCSRRSRQGRRVGPVPLLVPRPPPLLPLPRVLRGACGGSSGPGVPCSSFWYATLCRPCVLRARSGSPFVTRHLSVVCSCARARAVFGSSPLPMCVGARPWRGPLAGRW